MRLSIIFVLFFVVGVHFFSGRVLEIEGEGSTNAAGGVGIKMNFEVHDVYLAAHTLRSKDMFSSESFKEDILSYHKYMEELSKDYYDKLMVLDPGEIRPDNFSSPKLKELMPYLLKAAESPSFQKILTQTWEYAAYCRDQWNGNYESTYATILEVTGLKMNKAFTVYVTHPSLRNQFSIIGSDLIFWGHNEDWANYTTVSLWHEVLRSFLPTEELSEIVIELLCDNHLRVKLNGGEYPPLLERNSALSDKIQKALEDWKLFLSNNKKNILLFIDQLRRKLSS